MSEPANNVLMFPKGRNGQRPQTLDEIVANLTAIRIIHVDDAVESIAGMLFDDMQVGGFAFESQAEYGKDVAMVIESIRSLLSKHHGVMHPFQFVADELFVADESGTIRLAECEPEAPTQ